MVIIHGTVCGLGAGMILNGRLDWRLILWVRCAHYCCCFSRQKTRQKVMTYAQCPCACAEIVCYRMSPIASFVSRNYMHTSIISSIKELHTIAQPQPRIIFSIMFCPRAVCQTAPTKDTRSVDSVRAWLVHNLKAGARCVQDVSGCRYTTINPR